MRRRSIIATSVSAPVLIAAPVATVTVIATRHHSAPTLEHAKAMPVWTHPDRILSDDKYWTVPENISYKEQSHREEGQFFYQNMTKDKDGHYPSLDLKQWYTTFDTDTQHILSDPNHKYKSTAPHDYSPNARNYSGIYRNDGDTAKIVHTGNNNNPINCIYSGASITLPKKHPDVMDAEVIDGTDQSSSVTQKDKDALINGWEHMSPQNRERNTWQTAADKAADAALVRAGKPKFAETIYKQAIGDLFNLRPSIQTWFNVKRSDTDYGMLPGDANEVPKNPNVWNSWGIDFEEGYAPWALVDKSTKITEPRPNVRGDIARDILYMHDRYHVTYDYDYYKQMIIWAAMDPVTPEEIAFENKVADKMGFHNGYVTGEKQLPYLADIADKITQTIEEDDSTVDDNDKPTGIINSFTWKHLGSLN